MTKTGTSQPICFGVKIPSCIMHHAWCEEWDWLGWCEEHQIWTMGRSDSDPETHNYCRVTQTTAAAMLVAIAQRIVRSRQPFAFYARIADGHTVFSQYKATAICTSTTEFAAWITAVKEI